MPFPCPRLPGNLMLLLCIDSKMLFVYVSIHPGNLMLLLCCLFFSFAAIGVNLFSTM
jgi:hypothetical protein